jgi:hypothetical protein
VKSRRLLQLLSLATAFGSVRIGQATTYYVSPTGSDTNSGTSPSSAWQSLTKVDDTTLAPGSTVLFQDGGDWYGSQLVAQSGTAAQPITYSSYGNGASPTFWGSVPIPSSALLQVQGTKTGTTYFIPINTPVNAFYINHQFTHNADLVSNMASQAGNIAYVESTPNSSYYISNGSSSGIIVNTGQTPNYSTPFSVYSAAIQQDVILDYYADNVVFNNLTVRESAAENGGYGIRVENSNNVQVLNCTVTGAGKHAVGAIDANNFVAENLTASNLLPDQGYGGATGYVAYADSNVTNTTSQWINCNFNNPGGSYQGFITHSTGSATNPTPISSVLVQNANFNSFPSITIESAPAGENVNIVGGAVTGDIQLSGSNTVVNGVTVNGTDAEISVGGTNNTIENTIINGDVPNTTAGRNAAIDLGGSNNIIRFNTIALGPGTGLYEAAIGEENNTSGDQIYGNIINSQFAAFYVANGGVPDIDAHDNLFSGYQFPEVIYPYSAPTEVEAWPKSISSNELYGQAEFSDPADGDLSISPTSIAAYVFDPATNEYVMYDYYGNERPSILESLGAVQVPEQATTGIGWNVDSDGAWETASNWTNDQVPDSTDIIALLGPGITAPRTVTISTAQTVGVLYFSSPVSYTVAGTGTLSLNSSSGASAIDVSAGNHFISVALNLTDTTAVNLAIGSVLTVGGSVSGTGSLTANGGGTLLFGTSASIAVPLVANGNITFASNGNSGGFLVQKIPSLEIGQAGLAVLADPGTGNQSNRTLLVTSALIFDSTTGGQLDLNSNDLDVKYGNLAQITAEVASGYNTGSWNGIGIISSAAAADTTHLMTLGVILNSTGGTSPTRIYGLATGGLGTFDGTRPLLTDVLVKYTYYGDANLDGKVDGSDYSLLDNGYLNLLTGWYNGDFNYDGVIDGSDYTLIDNAYNTQGAQLQASVAVLSTAEIAVATPVPEPAIAAVLTLGLMGWLGRRRTYIG